VHLPTANLIGVAIILLAFSIIRVSCLVAVIKYKLVRFSIRFNKANALKMLRVSWPIGTAALLTFLMGKIDIFLLTYFQGEKAVGYYQAAFVLMDGVVMFLGTIRASLFPNLVSFYKKDRNRFYRIQGKANLFFAFVLILISIMFLFFSSPIINMLYGNSYTPTAKVLKIFSLSVIFMGLSAFLGNSLIAMDRQRPLMILTGVGCFIALSLNMLLIPTYGIYGSAWANAGTFFVMLVAMLLLINADKREYYRSE
jgi:O-antigen/teichoic acid export membrane protein